jgi:hypothetical protein
LPIISALPKVAYSFRTSAFGNGTAVGVGDTITTAVVGREVGDWTGGDVLVHPEKSITRNNNPKNVIVFLRFIQLHLR